MKRAISTWACASWVAVAGCGSGKDLTAEQLTEVVNAGRPALQACYQASLDKSPRKDEVRLEAVIHVEPSGEVSKVDLGREPDPLLSDCVQRAIAAMRFPKAGAATHASLPLIFRPEAPEG